MILSLRKAGFACGAFAFWGLVGCDTAETNAPVAGEKSTAAVAVAQFAKETNTKETSAKETTRSTQVTQDDEKSPETSESATATDLKAAASTNLQPQGAAASPPAPPADRPRLTNKITAKPGEMQEVTFDTIKLPMEKDQAFQRSLLTPEVVALDGQPIRIRGYILPSFQQTGITQFVLVRDNLQCCFGPGAALFDCIIVEMKSGKSADYTVRPVSVEGKFTLAEMVNPDDGKHLAIYHLDGEKVQ